MQLPADILLAARYLRPKRTFVSIITLLSVFGPMLGVALLIIVTSVMAGFDRNIRERILGMQAHLQLAPVFSARGRRQVIEAPEHVLKALKEAGAVGAPIIEGPILIQQRDQVVAKFLKGIVPKRERLVTNIHEGESFRGRFEIEEGEALIGSDMALELGVDLGDEILIHSPARLTQNVKWEKDGQVKITEPDEVYVPEEVKIVGIFSLGVSEYDSGIVFVCLDQAADLFGYEWGSATTVHARVPDPFAMDEITRGIEKRLPQMRVVTWQQANRMLFGALKSEKSLMFFLLTFIVIVASFAIAGTLVTVAVQKTREIGVMKAMGMGSFLISRVFLLQGMAIGMMGTSAGVAVGLTVLHFRDKVADLISAILKVDIFPKTIYHLSSIPSLTTVSDLVLIVSLALLICLGASLLPALYASALSPAAAFQDEN